MEPKLAGGIIRSWLRRGVSNCILGSIRWLEEGFSWSILPLSESNMLHTLMLSAEGFSDGIDLSQTLSPLYWGEWLSGFFQIVLDIARAE